MHIEKPTGKPATHQSADYAKNDVANQTKARALYGLTRRPTGNCTDNNPR